MLDKYSYSVSSESEPAVTNDGGDEEFDEEYGPDLESGITGSGSESGSGDDDSGDDDDGDGGDGGDGGGDGGGCSENVSSIHYDQPLGHSGSDEAGDDNGV
jgi:hypothetical protein